MWDNSSFFAELNPCKSVDDLLLSVTEHADSKVPPQKFDYNPEISIKHQLLGSFCRNSNNMVVYQNEIIGFGINSLYAKTGDSTKTDIIKGINKDVTVGESKTITLFFN